MQLAKGVGGRHAAWWACWMKKRRSVGLKGVQEVTLTLTVGLKGVQKRRSVGLKGVQEEEEEEGGCRRWRKRKGKKGGGGPGPD